MTGLVGVPKRPLPGPQPRVAEDADRLLRLARRAGVGLVAARWPAVAHFGAHDPRILVHPGEPVLPGLGGDELHECGELVDRGRPSLTVGSGQARQARGEILRIGGGWTARGALGKSS
jgi:hypothetical protein